MAGPDLPFSSQSSSLAEKELELELELVRVLEPPEDHAGGEGDDAVDDAVPQHIRQPASLTEKSELHSKRPWFISPLVPYWREEPVYIRGLGAMPLKSFPVGMPQALFPWYTLSLSGPDSVERAAKYQSMSLVARKEQLSLSS